MDDAKFHRLFRMVRRHQRTRTATVLLCAILWTGYLCADRWYPPMGRTIRGQRIELRSPNGKGAISIVAADRTPGIWINRGSVDRPMTGMYVDPLQGAVVGVFARDTATRPRRAFDAAISAGGLGNAGGSLQIIDDQNRVSFYSGEQKP